MPNEPTCRRGGVLVVYPHLPHYRGDVFRALDGEDEPQYYFAADIASRDRSIACLDPKEVCNFLQVNNNWFGPFLWQSGLLRWFRLLRPQALIILGDSAHLSSWVIALAARITRTPVLFWTIGWHRPEKGLKRIYRLSFYRLADRMMLYGNSGRRLGEAMGYPPDRMGVIYNSSSSTRTVVDSTVAKLRPLNLPSGKRPVIGAVIRLQPAKQLERIIESAARLRDEHGIEADVLLVGAGPSEENLRATAKALGVRLFLPGPVYSDSELQEIYSRLTVTVLPTLAGLSVIQSLRFGIPVITHDNPYEQVPEFEAIEAGRTGDLYQYGSRESLTETIRRWLERPSSERKDIETACLEAVATRWNAEAQALAIKRELDLATASGSKA